MEYYTESVGLNFHLFLKLLLARFAYSMLGCRYEPSITVCVLVKWLNKYNFENLDEVYE